MTCTVPVSSETTTEGIFQDFNGIYHSFYLLPLSSFLIHFLHHIHPFIQCPNLSKCKIQQEYLLPAIEKMFR